MATDIEAILMNLDAFYDFSGKSVIHVGAGGGQLIGYAGRARSVLAVDSDLPAVERLRASIQKEGLTDRFDVVHGEFASSRAEADVVFFEFCLHEIADPAAALLHARSLAAEVLVADHQPDSSWSWYTCETEKVQRSWGAVERLEVIRRESFTAIQRFSDYAELVSRVEVLGEPALSRVKELEGRREIEIAMPYGMALLSGAR
jgi:hypothetical protein